jgi:hypothetical protein
MAHYRTFMVNLVGALPQDLAWGVQSQLANLFSPCTSDRFENNWVYFADLNTKLDRHELLVYFMPPNVSVIKNVPHLTDPPDLTADGNTAYAAGASEVYVKNRDPALLAKLAFHELMHNRLKLGDTRLHPQGGLASAEINASTQLTPQNIRTMAAAIDTPIKQWTDGIATLLDPNSEYYRP